MMFPFKKPTLPPSTPLPISVEDPLPLTSITTSQLRQEAGRWCVQHRQLEVEVLREKLAEGVSLPMVRIPAGSFLMGSPQHEPERWDVEGPQREVTLRAFFLAQTPITQAQWQVVAGWNKEERELQPDPARFKAANRPVEQVSWHEAIEFCRRLSLRTGKSYGLPSEAQWEYACRAGTTTPFHFGATLTPDLSNYYGKYTYCSGPNGTYRQQTTEVATFSANSWGLYDMHGNVNEWCADHWHDSYDCAPEDEQPWFIPAVGDEVKRLMRGGSWSDRPYACRSAFRSRADPSSRLVNVGFRVSCLH